MEALREYVLYGPTGEASKQLTAPPGEVRLVVKHSILKTQTERNFSLQLTVGQLKEKLQLIVGTSPQYQELELQDKDGVPLAMLDEDSFVLSKASPQHGSILFVIDTDPSGFIQSVTDTSLAPKNVMSDEDYAKRENTYKKWKEENPDALLAKKQKEKADLLAQFPKDIHIGDRCESISTDGSLARRGTVRFVGTVDFAPGYWVGVQLDEPLGKNDGSVSEKRYFTCLPKYGVFVKPDKIVVGDFPEEDFGLSDEEL